MNKNRIRLTESQLHRVIKESVKKVLNEWNDLEGFGFFPPGDNRDDDVRKICNQFKKYADKVYYEDGDRGLSDAMTDACYNGNTSGLQPYAKMFADEYGYSLEEVWKPIKWCANNMFDY